MKVKECMTNDIQVITTDHTLQSAAQVMSDNDIGFLPVVEDDRLIGILTDRDITIRAVAAGCPPDESILGVMSAEVKYCFEDEDIAHVMDNMGDIQLRRLPVMNREKRLVGIISLSDCAGMGQCAQAGQALGEITRPSALHSQMV